jgi:riboflavin biosynthesis pyrimidine reductase
VTALELLDERPGLPPDELTPHLSELYGGGLGLAQPCLVANFVQTIDGVVAIPGVERSNALIAAGSDADRFVIALLRAFADVILLGAATMRASPTSTWRPAGPFPAAEDELVELRRRRGRGERPVVAVVTTGRFLPVGHPALEHDAIVLTTIDGASRLRGQLPAAAELVAVNDGDRVDLALALAALRVRGHSVVVSEAGPHTFAELAAGGLVDELFVTQSPLLAGRGGDVRYGLAEGLALLPDEPRRAELLSVRRSGSHLFLRYGFGRG